MYPRHTAPETTIYFVVAEAMTNIAKHSGATRASVHVVADRTQLTVHDDDRSITHSGGQPDSIVTSTGLKGEVPHLP